jgi:transposase
MPIPLPIELRHRVVDAFNAGGGTLRELSDRFSISAASMFRWVKPDRTVKELAAEWKSKYSALVV